MTNLREAIKRATPLVVRNAINEIRARLAPPPLELIVRHPYQLLREDAAGRRLTLVIPNLSKDKLFGGVATGVEIFLECAARLRAAPRIVIDDFDRRVDMGFLARAADRAGLAIADISILHRDAAVPQIAVRREDFFFAFNWWTALNVSSLLSEQERVFGLDRRPLVYIIQEYEPLFHPMSSTHLHARQALANTRNWAIINSSQMAAYMHAQGHRFARDYVFEPRLADSLRPFLSAGQGAKERTVLVYGRPTNARNCFSAIVEGLRTWANRFPEFKEWTVLSAGSPHPPVPLPDGRVLRPLGKLSLDAYGACLQSTGVGLSLMASPHPSYPPLEMAHFGIRTITNAFTCKDLSEAHDNIISLPDIDPDTIASALASACRAVEADPAGGWRGRSNIPSYLETGPLPIFDRLIPDLEAAMLTASPGEVPAQTA